MGNFIKFKDNFERFKQIYFKGVFLATIISYIFNGTFCSSYLYACATFVFFFWLMMINHWYILPNQYSWLGNTKLYSIANMFHVSLFWFYTSILPWVYVAFNKLFWTEITYNKVILRVLPSPMS